MHPNLTIAMVARDTTVLFVYNEPGPANNCVLKIGWEMFVYVNTVCVHFGHGICQALPGYHSIPGCILTVLLQSIQSWKS